MKSLDYTLAFLLRGRMRKRVFEEIAKGKTAPAHIYKTMDLDRSHVRRSIVELEEKGLIRCSNPKDPSFKLYVLTNKGQKVKKLLDNIQLRE